MQRKYRIILIFVVGALVGSLVIAVSLSNKVEEPYSMSVWDKARWAFHDVMVKLGLRRSHASFNPCICNLKQIDGAKATWALENKKTNTDVPTATDLYGAAAYIRDTPTCSSGGTYVIGSVQQKPTCSFGASHTL